MKKPMPEINMIFQCSLEIPALSISEKSVCLVSIDVGNGVPSPLVRCPRALHSRELRVKTRESRMSN